MKTACCVGTATSGWQSCYTTSRFVRLVKRLMYSRNVLFTKSNLFAGCQRPCPVAVCVSNCVCATHTHTVVSTSAKRTSITIPSLPALLSPEVCSWRSCYTVYCVASHCQTPVSVPRHTYERTDTGEHSPDRSYTQCTNANHKELGLISHKKTLMSAADPTHSSLCKGCG